MNNIKENQKNATYENKLRRQGNAAEFACNFEFVVCVLCGSAAPHILLRKMYWMESLGGCLLCIVQCKNCIGFLNIWMYCTSKAKGRQMYTYSVSIVNMISFAVMTH